MANRKVIERFSTASEVETRHFLQNNSVVDDDLMRELWNVSSGLPGLLDARPPESVSRTLRKGEKDFVYDPLSKKYKRMVSHRAVSEREIRLAVAKVSAEAKNRVRQETKQMMAGVILFAVWYQRCRSILKALYRAIWIVSLGGALFESQAERYAFYIWVLLLFDRFDQLKESIEGNLIPFDGRVLTAVGNIARNGNCAYQNIMLQKSILAGHKEARRVLGENENHCHDSAERPGCVELADLGWIPIDQMVPLGMATCWDNCLCQIDTR